MLSKKLIREVMREWSWKVPTGMPDVTKASHLQILREVLINDFKLSAYNVDKILEALSKSKYINLSYAAMAMKKTTQFNGFLKSITTEAGNLIEPTLNKLEAEQKKLEKTNKGLKPNNKKYTVGKQCQEFFNMLYSVNKVESLKKIPSSGLASTIFNLGGGTGMPGKGEVWASIMVPKTVVSGTSKSYDLSSPGGNYEVKDNRTGGSIRLGVHASLEKFDWWKEIVKTSNTVKDILSNTDLISVLQPLYGASALNLISALENVNSRIGATVGKGAFGKKDIDYHNVFFQVANKFGTSNVQGYTEIQFHGPNRSKIVRSISPLEKSNIPNN